MKTENNIQIIDEGDWISTTEIDARPGQKYTNAFVKKVLKNGKLKVIYGSYMSEAIVAAKDCKLIKKA